MPCARGFSAPSAWMRSMSAAWRTLQNRARAMLPPLPYLKVGPVRVMATRKPARKRSVRVRFAIARLTAASPAVPPPSLIFVTCEPGPIGSVCAPIAGGVPCPGSRQMSAAAARGARTTPRIVAEGDGGGRSSPRHEPLCLCLARRAGAVHVERRGRVGLLRVAELEPEGDRCRLVAPAEEGREAGDRVHAGSRLDPERAR